MRGLVIAVFLISIIGCSGDGKKDVERIEIDSTKNNIEIKKDDFVVHDISEEGIRKKLTEFLNNGDNKLLKNDDFHFYRGQMSRDTILDWVVTVNTLEYAKKSLTAQGNLMPIDYGYLGNYNHFFIINGETGKMSGRPVGSSALEHLEIDIDYVNSDQYQVAKIFFRLGTSKFVAIYNSSIPSFQEIFSWEIFNLSDQKNNGLPTGSVLEFVGPENGKKEIHIYEANILDFSDEEFIANMYSYEPSRTKKTKEPSLILEYLLIEGKYGQVSK